MVHSSIYEQTNSWKPIVLYTIIIFSTDGPLHDRGEAGLHKTA